MLTRRQILISALTSFAGGALLKNANEHSPNKKTDDDEKQSPDNDPQHLG